MSAPRMVVSAALHLDGAEAPRVWTLWHDDDELAISVLFDAGPNQRIGFVGTAQEVRLALASGLHAVDRAVAERAAPDAPKAVEEMEASDGAEPDRAAEFERARRQEVAPDAR